MFCYQKNTHFSQAVGCSRENFWEEVRRPSTSWAINARRDILEAVNLHRKKAVKVWLGQTEFQKFLVKKEGMKKESAKEKFMAKSDEEKLLAYAQDLKENLPAFIFSCSEFDATPTQKKKDVLFRHRRLADCHLNGLVMLDIDHVQTPFEVFEKLKENEELMRRTVFVHVTSSKKGIRVVFIADAEVGNLADNQIEFAQQLGYKADRSCIDATRNSFAPKMEDILYIDESRLFGYYDEEFDKKYTPMYRKGQTQPLNHKFEDEEREARELKVKSQKLKVESEEDAQLTWRGFDVQRIIDQRFAEKLPCKEDSNRHNESLKLASDLLILFDGDKQKVYDTLMRQSWVQEIVEERDEDVEQTVKSAAGRMQEREKKYLTQMPSPAMQEAIEVATGRSFHEIVLNANISHNHNANCQNLNYQLEDWGEQIEALFPKFPILKDVCKGLKRNQYPAAVFVAGGLMMTLMTRCTYRFYHRPEELRRLNNSTLIIGDPASGKSFATRLYKLLTGPIVVADMEGRKAINAYREEMKTKGANKEKPKKPKVVVRIHPARTSNAQFIQDMVNAVEVVDGEEMHLHMLTFDTELDNTVSVQKGGSWIDKQSLELKAFHNEEDGQAYSNNDSIFQDFYVFWNFIYTGTPIALKKKVNEQNFGNGLATRLTCIPLPTTNFKMLERESHVDIESDERLKECATRLDRMKGELPVQKIVDALYDWTARRMEDAEENHSRADEMLLKRCAYHGLNFSAPFIVLRHWESMHEDGQYCCGSFETDEVDWQLAELLVNIQFACQRHFFGHLAEKYFDNQDHEASVNVKRKQKSFDAFERLPEEFTIEDVMRCFNQTSDGAARMRIKRLMDDHLVERTGEFKANGTLKARYRKTGALML